MPTFNIKTLLAAETLAGAATLAASPAHATYEGCMARNADPIGCWLSEKLGGEYIMNPDMKPSDEDGERFKKLMSAGYIKFGPINGETSSIKEKRVQTCETGKILDMIEKKAGPETIAKSCYK